MSTYLIGDIHGCYEELQRLLERAHFDPTVDKLWLTGDLVARGPHSLEVLRLIRDFGNSVKMVLGNHDLKLLAIYHGISQHRPQDRLMSFLEAPDAGELIDWLRHQPILQVDEEKKLVMVHAGIIPQWNIDTAQIYAHAIEKVLRSNSDEYLLFLRSIIYGKISNNEIEKLSGIARLQFINTVFTVMRYCFINGQLDIHCKDSPEKAPSFLYPWFALPGFVVPRRYSIVFGHWSTLMGKRTPPNIYGLDTGCCWGGELTLMHWEKKQFIRVSSSKRRFSKN